MNPQVSIVIPSWRGLEILKKTLPAILAQKNVSYQTLLVENGIVDETYAFAKTFPNLDIIRIEKNIGYAGAVNRGVQEAKADLVLVLCNDNLPDPTWLENFLAIYSSLKSPKAVLYCQYFMPAREGSLNILGRNVFTKAWRENKLVSSFYPGGNAFLYSKASIGLPFLDEYFTYQEDVFLGFQVRSKGGEIFAYLDPRLKNLDPGTPRAPSFKTRYYTERNRCWNLLLFLELSTLLKLAPLFLLDSLAMIFFSKGRRAKIVAWISLPASFLFLFQQRNKIQSSRTQRDNAFFPHLLPLYISESPSAITRLVNSAFRFYLQLFKLS